MKDKAFSRKILAFVMSLILISASSTIVIADSDFIIDYGSGNSSSSGSASDDIFAPITGGSSGTNTGSSSGTTSGSSSSDTSILTQDLIDFLNGTTTNTSSGGQTTGTSNDGQTTDSSNSQTSGSTNQGNTQTSTQDQTANYPTVSIYGAGFSSSLISIGQGVKAYINATNTGTTKFRIGYRITYSKDGTSFTGTAKAGSVFQSGTSSERLETGSFKIYNTYRKIKVEFIIPNGEDVKVDGSRTLTATADVVLPTVGITQAGFSSGVLMAGDKVKVRVTATNTGTDKYRIDYKLLYSKDGVTFPGSFKSGTFNQSGKSSESFESSEFTINSSYKKIKLICAIPRTQPVNATGTNPLEIIREINLPTVSMTGIGFNTAVTAGGDTSIYIDTTNSGTQKFKIAYKVYYSTDGTTFERVLRSGNLFKSGQYNERIVSPSFTVNSKYKKLKLVCTIPDNQPVNISGKSSIEVVVPVSGSK